VVGRKRGVRALGFESYAEYLRSERWQTRRRRFFAKRRRLACYVCRAEDKPLDLHHKTYIRVGRERDSDLIMLCRECHKELHAKQSNHWAMWNTHKRMRKRRKKAASG
jgi:hypothetical protein